MFNEKRFTSIPRPKSLMQSSNEDQIGEAPVETPTVRRKEDLRMFDEAMKSRDVAFWKEAINDEMDSIMENNTWILSDLPPGYKPLGCKWIFKRKMKVDGTIDKFKARLVIQCFRQKEVIDYFDTYAHVARISTIRLLIALAATYNLVIHQMNVKTSFLNGDLKEEVYMKQPEGFIMPGNKHKSDKCVYCKFDKCGNGVIICLYVDDMLIFGTDQDQVEKTKEFLSLNFSMKDMEEADVILGIRIKREDKGITITQSHYIEKILKKFKCDDCCSVRTPLDPTIKLMPNTGRAVDQLEYSRVIEDHTSTTSWVFLLGGGAISWASKKQTCITDSTIEVEFVALAAAGKEAEWLRNLIYEILLWPKPISPISIHCDSAANLAKAYCQIYNGKYRHLGVRHSMVHELITNGVISVDFVRSQQNLADHLTKGLARDLMHKSAIGMGLKSIEISNDETPNSLLANVRS
ncbi:zinc finger, CCHC-type containing protein [Tanacetum coccineum]